MPVLRNCQRFKSCDEVNMNDHRWLKVPEAAGYAGVSRDTIYTACERGELRHARVGGRRAIRLRADWIDAWLERHARDVLTLRAGANGVS
jgi:excisionase family DNA binding protein